MLDYIEDLDEVCNTQNSDVINKILDEDEGENTGDELL